MSELKTLSTEAVPAALEKAEHYRLLNEPEEAESICQDVLAADPANQRALIVLLLARTDLGLIPIPEVEFACGSASTIKVLKSSTARLAARFIAVVVFPTPPF